MAINQIIDMIAMRHRFVTTARPMNMVGLMTAAFVIWGAS